MKSYYQLLEDMFVGLAVPAGFFVGAYLAHRSIQPLQVQSASRRSAMVTTCILALVCAASAFFALRDDVDFLPRRHESMAGDDELIAALEARDHLDAVALDGAEGDVAALGLPGVGHIGRVPLLQWDHRQQGDHDGVLDHPAGQAGPDDLPAAQQTFLVRHGDFQSGRAGLLVGHLTDERDRAGHR